MSGRVFLNRYQTISLIGQGSMAQVFLAFPLDAPDERVVVKILHANVASSDRFRRFFQKEIEVVARLNHPYIVRFIDASPMNANPACLVLEYLPGVTLDKVIAHYGRIPIGPAATWLGYIGHALEMAHHIGIIHGDLKPPNVMMLNLGEEGETLKVADFGLASIVDRPTLELGSSITMKPLQAQGTPIYIAPEKLRGDLVDHRSDIYSLGVMLFEMLSGFRPFGYDETAPLLQAHLIEKPRTFAQLGIDDVPAAVESIVQQCLMKFPAERPGSARALVDMFSRVLDQDKDIWALTSPPHGTPPEVKLPSAAALPHSSHSTLAMLLPVDDAAVTYYLDAWMPEQIAVMKIKGFITEVGGKLLVSEAGRVTMRIGDAPPGVVGKLFSGIGLVSRGPEPMEVDLLIEKPNPMENRLRFTVVFHPPEGYRLRDPVTWRKRADRHFKELQAFFMASR